MLLNAVVFAAVLGVIGTLVFLMVQDERDSGAGLQPFGEAPEDEDYPLDSISLYHAYNSAASPETVSVDEITWNDLDMDRVFRRLNLCESSVGEEYLYALLHKQDLADVGTKELEACLSWLGQNEGEQDALRLLFYKLGKRRHNGLPYYLYNAGSKRLENGKIFKAMALLPLLFAFFMVIDIRLGIWGLALSAVANSITYHVQKQRIERELRAIQCFSSLLWCAQKLCAAGGLEGIPYVERIRSALPAFKAVRGRMSGLLRQRTGDIIEGLVDAVRMLFLVDIIRYDQIVATLEQNTAEMHAIYENVARLDIACSVSSFRCSLGCWCVPEFRMDNAVEFQGMYHPLLKHPVTNGAVIARNSLITGSNASGKSTFLKSIAVNALLAMAIHTCCASAFSMHRALVITSMALRDDIVAGESYFITEIKSLRRIMEKIREMPCLCFIDEILRGTNTDERIAASTAVLRELYKHANCRCIAATHDLELTEALCDRYENYHFEEQLVDGEIAFDYKLRPGPSKTRNALLLLEALGFSHSVVEDAKALYAQRQCK